jgi:hypothetical protein
MAKKHITRVFLVDGIFRINDDELLVTLRDMLDEEWYNVYDSRMFVSEGGTRSI